MGHNRVGGLPRTFKWREVIALLDAPNIDAGAVASKVVDATDARFRRLADDVGITDCFWLLTRVVGAARDQDFTASLRAVGVEATAEDSALTLVAKVADAARAVTGNHQGNGQYVEVAALALRQALAETVLTESNDLFGSASADVQRSFRVYSTEARFGALARRFFSHFMTRALQAHVDRELSNHVGTSALPNVDASKQFLDALGTHTWQAARIVEDFAGGWYSKNNYSSAGQIDRDAAQRFTAVALRKLRTELRIGDTG